MPTCDSPFWEGYGVDTKLEFILGRAGTGKSRECLTKILERVDDDPLGAPLLLIVPEHMTYQAERSLISGLSGRASMRASVYGFRRLAWKTVTEAGGGKRPGLTDLGKRMLLKKILTRREAELTVLARPSGRRGFTATLAKTIEELKTYSASPEALRMTAEKINDAYLRQKLSDIVLIFSDFAEDTIGKYEDAEDRMDSLKKLILVSPVTVGAEVWLDGFIFFNPQERNVISSLMKAASKVHITLPLDRDIGEYERVAPSYLFYRAAHTLQVLKRMAGEAGVIYSVKLLGEPRRFSPALAAVERSLFSFFPETHAESEGIRVVEAETRRTEVEAAVSDMADLCRSRGFRCRDIAVLIRDAENYKDILEYTLADYGLPFFSDGKRKGVHHPLAALVRSALEVMTGGWAYDDVFRCVKTGLFPLTRDEEDILENYVLEFGIRGEKGWQREWTYWRRRSLDDEDASDGAEEELISVNLAREKVARPLAALSEDMRRAKSVRERTLALAAFLTRMSVKTTIESWAKKGESDGRPVEAKEHRMMLKLMTELFEQAVNVGGDDEMTLLDYEEIISDGVDAIELALIPQGLDSVTIAPFDQNSINNVRAVYILGATEGVMPRRREMESLITDADRGVLAASEGSPMELAPGGREASAGENYLLYHGFTEASDYLWVSYPLSDSEGRGLGRSPVVTRLLNITQATVDSVSLDGTERGEEIFKSGSLALSHLAPALREYRFGRGRDASKRWAQVYNWALKNSRERLSMIVSGLFASPGGGVLYPPLASRLFVRGGRLKGSVTRLESFNSCPFRHFMEYGMRLSERREHSFAAPDLGLLLHHVMRRFGERMKADERRWKDVSADECSAIAREILDEEIPKLNNAILMSTEQFKNLRKRIGRTTEAALLRLAGFGESFSPHLLECAFGPGTPGGEVIRLSLRDGTLLSLSGRIDRVDTFSDEDGRRYFLVIDYKTGTASVSLPDVYYGLSLQLLTYLIAAAKILNRLGGEWTPAGVLYCFLKNPVLSEERRLDAAGAAAELMKKLRMNGWLLGDADIIRKIDAEAKYVKVRLTKGGIHAADAGNTMSLDGFRVLARHTLKKLREAGEAIAEGDISIRPFRRGSLSPCARCRFREVCGFDTRLGYEWHEMDETADFMAEMERDKPCK